MIQVQLEYELNKVKELDTNWVNMICNNIFNDNNHIDANITIILSDDDRLCKLKKEYFNKDLLTDVISFNLEENGEPIEGEVYISFDRIKENAIKFNQSLEKWNVSKVENMEAMFFNAKEFNLLVFYKVFAN